MWAIRDKTAGPQGFPLKELLEAVIKSTGVGFAHHWRIKKAQGYGADVCSLDDQTAASEEGVVITVERINNIVNDPNQWFFDFSLRG
jgi:hypothetical protein